MQKSNGTSLWNAFSADAEKENRTRDFLYWDQFTDWDWHSRGSMDMAKTTSRAFFEGTNIYNW